MAVFSNLDLISIGLAIAGLGVLGFMVYFNNSRSATNRAFLFLTITIILWSALNYLSYQFSNPIVSFWILRFVIFSAVLFSYFVFKFFYVFPKETAFVPKPYNLILILLAAFTAILTLTPFVFYQIGQISGSGEVLKINNGFGIYIFGVVVVYFDLMGIFFLIKRMKSSKDLERRQFSTILIGIILTIALILIFNFILPAFFDNARFIPLSGLFVLPFVGFTAYAIFKHHLLNVKVITTEILAFLLSIITLFEVFASATLMERLLRGGIFLLVLVFSILLIRSVLREVQQREQLQVLDEKLEAANAQLEELSRFKSQLLSLASHQMRSPLAAIKGFGSLLIQGSYGPISDSVKTTVDKMNRSAQGLLDLINTLLDMRKVEEGKMEYQFVRTDLTAMVANIVDLLRPLADTKKLEFTFASPGKEMFINADADKFKQVIQNLVDNAIKYTMTGFVHVELHEDSSANGAGAPPAVSAQGIPLPPGANHGSAIVSVSDSGYGIPATLVPHLFEEFIRDERVKKQILGTGLGLYIARKIAEAHNGTITAESAGEGKGSTFHIIIPLA